MVGHLRGWAAPRPAQHGFAGCGSGPSDSVTAQDERSLQSSQHSVGLSGLVKGLDYCSHHEIIPIAEVTATASDLCERRKRLRPRVTLP